MRPSPVRLSTRTARATVSSGRRKGLGENQVQIADPQAPRRPDRGVGGPAGGGGAAKGFTPRRRSACRPTQLLVSPDLESRLPTGMQTIRWSLQSS